LLGLLLAQAIQAEFVGELEILWQRGVIENRLCGCGVEFSTCPFWTRVGAQGFGGWSKDHAQHMISLKTRISRRRYMPWLLRGRGDGAWNRAFQEYVDTTARLYRAAHDAAEGRALIDSSKTPTHAATLTSAASNINIRLVHIVRDSRGVAYSKTKKQALLDRPGAMHERFPPLRTGIDWLRDNLLIERVRAARIKTSLVRYEDLASEPWAVIQGIIRDLELTGLVTDGSALGSDLAVTHSVAGNPMRFSAGGREVRVDDEWRGKMRRRDQLAVGALTWPLLIRYGFVRSR